MADIELHNSGYSLNFHGLLNSRRSYKAHSIFTFSKTSSTLKGFFTVLQFYFNIIRSKFGYSAILLILSV